MIRGLGVRRRAKRAKAFGKTYAAYRKQKLAQKTAKATAFARSKAAEQRAYSAVKTMPSRSLPVAVPRKRPGSSGALVVAGKRRTTGRLNSAWGKARVAGGRLGARAVRGAKKVTKRQAYIGAGVGAAGGVGYAAGRRRKRRRR